MRTHWSKLRPIPGYVRVEDRIGERKAYNGGTERVVVRMMRCEIDGAVIPTLGRGYHERGRSHREAAERQWRTEVGS